MSSSSFDPHTGAVVSVIDDSNPEEVQGVVRRAESAAAAVASSSPKERRHWLYAVADALEANVEELAELADRETALGMPRLVAEVGRTAGQLRFYGDVAVEASYLDVAVDHATDTTPALVRVNRPLGPVAVFGASNFPFAFSVLGNDTGAALAAGCPVVVKAHPAHVGLTMRQADIAQVALEAAGAPSGAFAVIYGYDAGVQLVKAPEISAVSFTGSQAGGLALWRIANERDVVIPVFAEMGTVNPVVVTPAGAKGMDSVAAGFVASFTLGHGQFCTKPGLMLAPAGSGAADAVAAALRAADPSPVMLTKTIADSIRQNLARLEDAGAEVLEQVAPAGHGWAAPAAVLRASPRELVPGSPLLEECFGPVVVVCDYDGGEQLDDLIGRLQGSLAATIIAAGEQDPDAPRLVRNLSAKAGRVTVNTWPTGVASTWAQHHGGPWPSTSNPAATSVGAHGLDRFVRPVTFQSSHDSWLPPEAQAGNPWHVPRRINGRLDSGQGTS